MESDNEDDTTTPIYFEARRTAILLIDCSNATCIQTSLKAAFTYFNHTVMSNTRKTNHLQVILCHPDDDKNIISDSKMNALDAYKKIFCLTKMTIDNLQSEFQVDTKEPFSSHLLRAVKQIKGTNNIILYATTQSDPTTDKEDRFQALSIMKDMEMTSSTFEVISLSDDLDFELFYDEVYETLNKPTFHYFYTYENMSEKLVDAIHFKEHMRGFDLYPYLGCKNALKVKGTSVTRDWVYHPTAVIHKVTLELLQSKVTLDPDDDDGDDEDTANHFLLYGKDGSRTTKITKDQYKALKEVDVPMGITLMQAKPLTEESYATYACYAHNTVLLGGHHTASDNFSEFWDGVKDLRVWCLFRFTRSGRVYNAELEPVRIGENRHFLVRFIPSVDELYFREPEECEEGSSLAFKALLKELLDEFCIEDFEPILRNLCPPVVAKELEYVKEQLLGREYQKEEIKDYLQQKWYKGDDEKIKECCESLEALSEVITLKRKAVSNHAANKRASYS